MWRRTDVTAATRFVTGEVASPAMRTGGSLHSCVRAEKCKSRQGRTIPRRHSGANVAAGRTWRRSSLGPNAVTHGLHAQMNGETSWPNGGRGMVDNKGDLRGREEPLGPTVVVSRIKSWNRPPESGRAP